MINKVFKKEKILDLVQENPGISAPEVAHKMGMSRVSAYHYLKALITDEQIRTDGNGKATRYFPKEITYVNQSLSPSQISLTPSEISLIKTEILFSLQEAYDEVVSEEDIDAIFEKYCMYIAPDDTIITGFNAFILWCFDIKHNFSSRIVPKAIEYLDIIGSIENRRKRNGFLDGTESARSNLTEFIDIAFDIFYFCMPSVLDNGFGKTRTALELLYGKSNGNRYLLEQAVKNWIDPMRHYIAMNNIDAVMFTPPTQGRIVQFRDELENLLGLKLPKITVEKVSPFGKILRPQKEIRGQSREKRKERVDNALISLVVTIPKELEIYKHVLIFDDSFTTGATPNAIALKLRNGGYKGKITVITICGSFNYDLAITEDEI